MKTLVLTCSLLVLTAASVRATHIAGSDMEFVCLGNDSFEVIYRIYRDCQGIALDNTIPITLQTQGCSPQRTVSFTLHLDTIKPIRYLCRDLKSICEGGSFRFGMLEYTYRDIVGLNQVFPGGLDPACCLVNVS